MNFKEEVLREYSTAHTMHIAELAASSPQNFKQLMKCFVSEEKLLSQRAAWSLGWAVRKNPKLINPYVKDLVRVLQRKNVHASLIRNTVRVLETIDIPEKYHGDVMNACFSFIEDPKMAPAIKAFSLTTLFNLCKVYPEIKQELKLIIEENWDHETPAFKSRGRKILAAFEKMN